MLSDGRTRRRAAKGFAMSPLAPNPRLERMQAEGCPGLCTSASGMASRFLWAKLVLASSPAAEPPLAHSY